MDDLSLADRLRLVRFELMLQRLPWWMVIALCDAIALVEVPSTVNAKPDSSSPI